MNAPDDKKIRRSVAVAIALTLSAGLSACVGSVNPSTDVTSPVAPRVQQLVDAHRTYPRWEDFPPTSTPLPSNVELAQQVHTLGATNGALAGEVSALQWQNGDPEVLVNEINRRIDASQMSPATVQTEADIEAYAEALRVQAQAPPPIDRHR